MRRALASRRLARRRPAPAAFLFLLATASAAAQDALVVAADADRIRDGRGARASVTWIHPRGSDTLVAGASLAALAGTRWAYGTLGGTRRIGALTMLNAEGNFGGGKDDQGSFRYVLVRGGVTRELVAKRLYAEAEWLQIDVARQQNGIVRAGVTFMPDARLTVRGSVYQSLFGDNDTSLATLRGDYALGRVTAIAGFSGGTATPVLVQEAGGDETNVREVFGGVAFGEASRIWTVILTAGEDRQRLTISCRVPLR